MKNKKIFILLICVLLIIVLLLFFIVKKFNVNETSDKNISYSEYTPEEEISSEQLRETMVNLYFLEVNSSNLKSEGKLIDSLNLLQNPYKELVELLISGPETEGLVKVFPDNTKILDATLDNNCVTLNFSQELLNYKDDNQKYNIINSILNTLSQLNEVNSIKIIINGKVCDEFNEEYSSML